MLKAISLLAYSYQFTQVTCHMLQAIIFPYVSYAWVIGTLAMLHNSTILSYHYRDYIYSRSLGASVWVNVAQNDLVQEFFRNDGHICSSNLL